MNITKVEIKNLQAFGLHSNSCDQSVHRKALPYMSVVQSYEGSYDISLDDGASYSTGPDGVFIAPANVRQTITHHVDPQSGYMSAQWVFMDVILNNGISLDQYMAFPVLLPPQYNQQVKELIKNIRFSESLCLSLSYAYQLVHILLLIGKQQEKGNRRTERIIQFVHENYDHAIDYDVMARHVGLSKSSLFRIFKAEFKKTPSNYINEYRIHIAVGILEDHDMTIKEIAYKTGFSDEFYFSKLFKQINGISPMEYKKRFLRQYNRIP